MLQPAFFIWHSRLLCSINQTNSLAASEGHQALLLPCVSPSSWLQRDNRKNNPGMEKQEDNTVSYFANFICLCCTRPCISSADSGQMNQMSLSKTECGHVCFLGFFFSRLWILGCQIKMSALMIRFLKAEVTFRQNVLYVLGQKC